MRLPFKLVLGLASVPLLGAAELVSTPESTPDPKPAPICHAEEIHEEATPATALLAGYGAQTMPVATNRPVTQAYFNNGLQLAHAFAHQAAISAFLRAEELDPNCAMCVWGEAWSRGPTINYPINDKDRERAAQLTRKAALLAANAPIKDKALIAALQVRYASAEGDEAFAQAMDALARVYPYDTEINVIAADAWQIAANGDKSHLARSIALLQAVLERSPNDVGAIHFYIHATEDYGVSSLAFAYAQRLQTLAPAASHLVHMPSHTFFWAGLYRQAETANLDATKLDEADARRFGYKKGAFGATYHGHNLAYGEAAAIEIGDGGSALRLAAELMTQIPTLHADSFWSQNVLAGAYFAYGRFGSKDEVLGLPDPGESSPYARVMWHYARGEAAARGGDVDALSREEQAIAYSDADAKLFGTFEDKGRAMVKIAQLVLQGRADMMQGRYSDAVPLYREAADLEEGDALGDVSDPPAFWYPARRGLAAAYLADGDLQNAEREAKKVLGHLPDEPLTLQILASVQQAKGNLQDAALQTQRKRANWKGDAEATPLPLV